MYKGPSLAAWSGAACFNSIKIFSSPKIWQCDLQMTHKITCLHHLLLCNQVSGSGKAPLSTAPWKATHLPSLLWQRSLGVSLQCVFIIAFREAWRCLPAAVGRGQDLKEVATHCLCTAPCCLGCILVWGIQVTRLTELWIPPGGPGWKSQALQWHLMAIYCWCLFFLGSGH